MVNELCDTVSQYEITEFSSRRLSKNVQSYLSILDVVDGTKKVCNNGIPVYFDFITKVLHGEVK
jgi:hypothetical protein